VRRGVEEKIVTGKGGSEKKHLKMSGANEKGHKQSKKEAPEWEDEKIRA